MAQSQTEYEAQTAEELADDSTEDLISRYKTCRLEHARSDINSTAFIAQMGAEAANIEDVLADRGITNEEIRALWKASEARELAKE